MSAFLALATVNLTTKSLAVNYNPRVIQRAKDGERLRVGKDGIEVMEELSL